MPGDPKGEWTAVAEAVGGQVISLGPGLGTRLNPLDVAGAARIQLLASLAETTLARGLRAAEHTALDVALTAAARCAGGSVTIADILTALTTHHPDEEADDATTDGERARDGRDLAHGLRRMVKGDLAGLFDGPSTVALDAGAPMVVLDLSRLGAQDDALAIAMTCASAWLGAALAAGAGYRWVIYDEAWRLLHLLPLIRRMQAQWKLSRAYGIASLLVLHRLSDLDAAGAHGSQVRSIAEGLLADCSTRVIYRQESDQLSAIAAALGLTGTERDLLPSLPRGTGLWKVAGRTHVVHHRVHPDEARVFDTDAAMRGGPIRAAS